MDCETIKIKLDDGAFMPVRAYKTDAGMDLMTPVPFVLLAHNSFVVDTGVHIQIPKGMAGMLKSKSGLNVKYSITSEGVIDYGYTGSIKVKLYNHGAVYRKFERGDKITQLVIIPVNIPVELEVVDNFEQSERGDNGFGSTGR